MSTKQGLVTVQAGTAAAAAVYVDDPDGLLPRQQNQELMTNATGTSVQVKMRSSGSETLAHSGLS